ncbi:MAG: type I 3-dehydroquinate dehydratase [Peptococcaceae bacterium]|nr:type I 3-dehydroquinate dehydratase [Peptococcaceae bacterium]
MFPSIAEMNVKGHIIGGIQPSVCVPLVARNREGLLAEAATVAKIKPDIVEWRADYYSDVENCASISNALSSIREILVGYPLIFTCRVHSEGGYREINREVRVALIKEVIRTGQVDIVDIELETGREIISEIVDEAHRNQSYVIVSNHDFKKTPLKEEIVERMIRAQAYGANIVKLAVMPNSPQDVLTLLEATLQFRLKHARVPVVSMAMSGQGVVSRIAGFLYGSAITFAAGNAASAPGQISISKLRNAIETLSDAL